MKRKSFLLKTFICIFVLLQLCLVCSYVFAYSVPDDTIVYVTDTGTKYHRDGCSYLKSRHPMTIAEAEKKGYEPCSRCNPDTLTGVYGTKSNGSYTSNNGNTSSSTNKTGNSNSQFTSSSVENNYKFIDLGTGAIGGTIVGGWLVYSYMNKKRDE